MKIKIVSFFICLFLFSNTNTRAQEKNFEKLYPYKLGNLRFKTNYLQLKKIKNTESKTDTIYIYNEWDKDMELSFKGQPPHISCDAVPNTLKKGSEGKIIITFDAAKAGTFGYVYNRFYLKTNDIDMADKLININADIVEDFGTLSREDLENAPRIQFEETRYDFGEIKSGTNVRHDFVFTNVGKKDLIIRSTSAGCGCTAISPEKSLIPPGESSKITVVFNTTGRYNMQHKSATVISNDPKEPAIYLFIKGNVVK
jgi:hypothetical protein